jgi:hypothetical protein
VDLQVPEYAGKQDLPPCAEKLCHADTSGEGDQEC